MLSHLPIVVHVIYFIRSWKGPRIFGLRLSLGSRSLQKTWGDGRAGGTEGREQKYSESDEELSLPVQAGSSDKKEAELILQSITQMTVVTPKLQGIYNEELRRLFDTDGAARPNKFSCLVCGKTARNGQHMRAHIEAKHVNGISVKCKFCKLLCKTLASLAQHERKKH